MSVAMRNVGGILLVSKRRMALVVASLLWISSVMAMAQAASSTEEPLVNDSHFHLTNYIQEGADIHEFLKVMGNKVGRVALFGIPLQQQWSYENSGDLAPTYYLQTDSPLYYYSFTDAYIAMAYRSLSKEEQARFEPMITGFNPTDMYAADHIRRVLQTFPGVFSGIGEFTIHKEFVSSKIAERQRIFRTVRLTGFSTSLRRLGWSLSFTTTWMFRSRSKARRRRIWTR
jgi:hypothetical protein